MTEQPLPQTAIFIDGDWLHYTTLRLEKELDYVRLKEVLEEHFGSNVPIYFFGSHNPQNKNQSDFMKSLGSLGYIVETAKIIRRGDITYSKGLDVRLTTRMAFLSPVLNTIVLISGDSDFAPVIEALRSSGKKTIVITIPTVARSLLIASDYHYINLERLIIHIENGRGFPSYKRYSKKVVSSSKKVVPPKNLYIEKGEFFAPYLAIRNLFKSAKLEIILIDPYVNDQILQMVPLLPKGVSIQILTNRISPADFCVQVSKLRDEGFQISIRKTNVFHDRFLSIDGVWWHSGHSFKDLGGKDSLITKIEDRSTVDKLKKRVDNELRALNEICV